MQNLPEGASTPEFGTKTYYFSFFSPKLHENERIKTDGWHTSLVPHLLGSATAFNIKTDFDIEKKTCFCRSKAAPDSVILGQDNSKAGL